MLTCFFAFFFKLGILSSGICTVPCDVGTAEHFLLCETAGVLSDSSRIV